MHGVHAAVYAGTVMASGCADKEPRHSQVFKDNMGKTGEPRITDCGPNDNWTKVSRHPCDEKL